MIKYCAYTQTGHDIIECYINSGGEFDEEQTIEIMHSISKNKSLELQINLINTINNFDIFYINELLIEYAAFIPINKYVERSVSKGYNITQNCFYNVVRYSNSLGLCKKIVNKYPSLVNEICLKTLVNPKIKI